MIRKICKSRTLLAGWFGLAATGTIWAQTPAALPPSPLDTTNVPPSLSSFTSLARKSPVAIFRELLATNSAGRLAYLTNRPPETQKQLKAKLREYQALNPNEREVRLQVTELRYYLWPLMNQPAAQRTNQLSSLPDNMRPLVESRLREWDALSLDAQTNLLKYQATILWMTELAASTNAPAAQATISPERRRMLEKGVEKFQAMSGEERQKTLGLFDQFFQLTTDEKQKVLNTLSEPERQQMQRTLRAFSQLTPQQRSDCMRSFEKFASLSVFERQKFLRNAEKWKLMTPAERQAWRNLVSQVPNTPPLPPGAGGPPAPRAENKTRPGILATNGN